MVSNKRYIFFFFLLVLLSCGKNEFTLDFELSSEVTENYDVTYYATDFRGGKTIQAVASVREGKCLLDGVTKHPSLIYITFRKSSYPLIIYAERENKIKISGDNKNPLQWIVEGNEINKELSEWRILNKTYLSDNITDSVNSAVRKYVEGNKENPVSLILMLCYYNRNVNERGYSELMGSLKGEAKKYEWLGRIARSDQLYHSYIYPASLKSLIMRSNKGNSDTVKTDGKNPVFLLFWETGYDKRKVIIDSLKILEKDFPDSTKIIADICLDIDSVVWRNGIRKDSLKNIKRLWAPTGMVDSAVMKFKVSSLPYFIVFDPEGKQIYRGKELSEAVKEYRLILKNK